MDYVADLVSPVDSSYVELYSRMMEQKMKTQETRRTKGISCVYATVMLTNL